MNIKFKVWWKPQIPMKAFKTEVTSREEGLKLCNILADYDIFQFENNIKPDYCNTGGVIAWALPISQNEDDWFDVPEDDDEWNNYYLDEIKEYESTKNAEM